MNIKEALKIILCDSQKGVDYNKFIKAEDYVLRFNENESYSASDNCKYDFARFNEVNNHWFNQHNEIICDVCK